MTSDETGTSSPSRRAVLSTFGVAGVGLAFSGCRAYDRSGGTGAPAPAGGGAASGATGGEVAKAGDIPVGGGKIFADQKVVVTQPSAGEFKAFSATCTHRQCVVSEVRNGTIDCACHNSSFKISDGSVVTGPATRPLPAATVKVENGKIVLG